MSHFNKMERLFLNSTRADVIFVVDSEEIAAHRAILGEVCPFFDKLLCGNFTEAKSKRVEITDTSAQVFKEVIRFIYLGRLEISGWKIEDLLGLLSLAHKYQIQELITDVIKALEEQLLDFDTWKLVNSAAAMFDSNALKVKCVSFLEEKLKDLLSFKDVEKITSEFVLLMFDTPKVTTCNQDRLLSALFEWKKYHNFDEIIDVFPKLCWDKVSPNITALISKAYFSNLKSVDQCNIWSEMAAHLHIQSEYVANIDNLLLRRNQEVKYELAKYECSLFCQLAGNSIIVWFKKNDSYFDILVKRVVFSTSNNLIVTRAYGGPTDWRVIELAFSQPTASNNLFEYSATFSEATSIRSFHIWTQPSGINEIKIEKLVIY